MSRITCRCYRALWTERALHRMLAPCPELLPRFRRRQLEADEERKLAAIMLETGEAPDGNGSIPLRRSADGQDPARLRGLPAIGRNVSGARVDTDPVRALLAKEALRERGR